MSGVQDSGRSVLRSLNTGAVLRAVVEQGPVSRAGIARATGLSNVTVGAIAGELLDQELIVENGDTDSTAGRPGRLLELNAGAYASIGVKLSDRSVTGVLTDLRSTVIAEASRPLEHPSVEDFVRVLRDLTTALTADAGFDGDRILGVGIGLPGVVDRDAGTAVYSPFLQWVDVPVADMVSTALGVPVIVENDVNTLALAERWFGRGQGVQDFLLVTIGQGIGLGVVLGGELHGGARGGVGELGHVVVTDADDRCSCGNVGCLEAVASQGALLRQSAELTGRTGAIPVVDMDAFYVRADNDSGHAALLDLAGERIGRAVANLVNLLSPELVLVRGPGHFEGSRLASTMTESVERHTFTGLAGRTEVTVEHLDDMPWARGAASLVLSELFMSPATVPGAKAMRSGRTE